MTKATKSETLKSAPTDSTAGPVTLCPDAEPPQTEVLNLPPENAETTAPRKKRTSLSELKSEIVLYARQNQGLEFSKWPERLRRPELVEELRKTAPALLKRKYAPERYFLTRVGFETAGLMISSATFN